MTKEQLSAWHTSQAEYFKNMLKTRTSDTGKVEVSSVTEEWGRLARFHEAAAALVLS